MRILVCPLDWGLGHAGRCIPLIRALRETGHDVRIAAAGGALRLLRGEFPELPWDEFPGYRVRYARSAAMLLPLLAVQIPAILSGWRTEKRRLGRLLTTHPCDLVISDGRYGLRAHGIPTLFITHQIAFRLPEGLPLKAFAERILLAVNLKALARFDRVWVPDSPPPRSLAGELAGPVSPPGNREWIGPLGRFTAPLAGPDSRNVPIDIAAVVSGPEPQRTMFEASLRESLSRLSGTRVLVRGLPGSSAAPAPGLASLRAGELNVFDHLPGGELARVFAQARALVARSGYTTVMELAVLGTAAAVLVPTPGQTEQEYLADHLSRLGAAVRREQGELDLAAALREVGKLPGFRAWAEDDAALRLKRLVLSHPLLAHANRKDVGKTVEQ